MKFEDGEIFATGKRYLVQPTPTKDKVGSIFIPETAHQRVQVSGIIRELGTDPGPYTCNVGDRVIHAAHAGASITIENETWKVLGEGDIVAVLRNTKATPGVGHELASS